MCNRIGNAKSNWDQIVEPGVSGSRHLPPGPDVEDNLVSARQQRISRQQRGIAASIGVGMPRTQLCPNDVANTEQRQRQSLGRLAKRHIERVHRQPA